MKRSVKNYVLYGEIGAGKTTALRDIVERYPAKVAGWLSPSVFNDQEKSGYDLLLIEQSQVSSRLPLLRYHPLPESIRFKDFFFHKAPLTKQHKYFLSSEDAVFLL